MMKDHSNYDSYPTVVMEMYDHQKPSPTPFIKLGGNSSGLYLESCKERSEHGDVLLQYYLEMK